ncbi:MAG: CsbD family protein [Alphaproteobacteria bacterium CG_4_9_14_3_um_filter_47_13]|nr:MAG: CsbD family protein [Alphaproteobacteria bacterium CG_4_9_14_3_um_filter_47_13]
MNEDIIKGKWTQIKGDIKTKWGKLTDDELDQIKGNRDKLIGKLQESYGKTRDEAEQELKDFEKKYASK